MRAAKDNCTKTLSILLEAGANLEQTNDMGLTSLAVATNNNATAAVRLLIQAGAEFFQLIGRNLPIWSWR